MREVEIEGQKIQVRGLKRSEIRNLLSPYGYSPTLFNPVKNEAGEVDLAYLDEGRGIILETVMTPDEIDRIETLGGNGACNKVINAIIAESYPQKEEEKNLSSSGNGAGTRNESEPATDALPSAVESA